MSKSSFIMDYCYFKDSIVPRERAHISIAGQSLQYGSTCFGGMRGYVREGRIRIFRLKDHHERLMNASKILGFGFTISYEKFEQILSALIEANKPEFDFYIRPFLFSENEVITVWYDSLQFNLGIYMVPMLTYHQSDKGLNMMISSWQKISDTSVPTKAKAGGFYVNSSLATTDARRLGYDEALLMDHNHNIVESSVSNLFIAYRGEVFTPPLGSDVLEGITWRTVNELLKEQGYTVRHESISRSMVYTCDELFLTGTAVQIIFARSVDGRIIGNGDEGPITKAAKRGFRDLIEMKHPKSKEYIREFS